MRVCVLRTADRDGRPHADAATGGVAREARGGQPAILWRVARHSGPRDGPGAEGRMLRRTVRETGPFSATNFWISFFPVQLFSVFVPGTASVEGKRVE